MPLFLQPSLHGSSLEESSLRTQGHSGLIQPQEGSSLCGCPAHPPFAPICRVHCRVRLRQISGLDPTPHPQLFEPLAYCLVLGICQVWWKPILKGVFFFAAQRRDNRLCICISKKGRTRRQLWAAKTKNQLSNFSKTCSIFLNLQILPVLLSPGSSQPLCPASNQNVSSLSY